jgi:hypothetical protein
MILLKIRSYEMLIENEDEESMVWFPSTSKTNKMCLDTVCINTSTIYDHIKQFLYGEISK